MTVLSAPIPAFETSQHDQWDRDDLLLLQQKALREWRDSDWLAMHDPRAYEAVMVQDPTLVRVDLGGGSGESQQVPGCIVVGEPGRVGKQSLALTDERREVDVGWMEPTRLPFDDATVDELHACTVPSMASGILAREIGRVMRLGGRVKTRATLSAAFQPLGGDWWECVSRGDPLQQVGPILINETVLGQPIRRARAGMED
jgi:hypothetical protein